jgi:hypothetical protein
MRFARLLAGILNQSIQPKRGGEQAPDDAGPDRVGRGHGEPRFVSDQVDDVEDDRSGQQSERKRNQHRVDRVAQRLCTAFHYPPSTVVANCGVTLAPLRQTVAPGG